MFFSIKFFEIRGSKIRKLLTISRQQRFDIKIEVSKPFASQVNKKTEISILIIIEETISAGQDKKENEIKEICCFMMRVRF